MTMDGSFIKGYCELIAELNWLSFKKKKLGGFMDTSLGKKQKNY